jgi:hypothetical protein
MKFKISVLGQSWNERKNYPRLAFESQWYSIVSYACMGVHLVFIKTKT